MRPNVLVTSAGRRVSLVRGFQAVAAPEGRQVIAGDATPNLSAACQVADRNAALPPVDSHEFSNALRDVCESHDIGLVVPTIDTELPALSALRESFLSNGTCIVVSDPKLVSVCADKRLTSELFASKGLAHPEEYVWPDIPRYPVFAKPFDGSLSRGIVLLHGREQLLATLRSTERLMLCEYKDPAEHDEFTIDCYYDAGGTLRCVVPRQRIEVRGGEVAKAMTVRNGLVTELFSKLGDLPGARGVLTIQAFVNRATSASSFIEINARFGGGYPLTRHAGADYQQMLVDEYLNGHRPETSDNWRDRTVMLRYDDEVVMFDV